MMVEFLLGDLPLGRSGEFKDSFSLSLNLAVFQVPKAQNNQFATVVYFGVAYSAILHICSLSHFSNA